MRQKRYSAKRRRRSVLVPNPSASSGQVKKVPYIINDTATDEQGQTVGSWIVSVFDKNGRHVGALGYKDESEARYVCALLGGG